MKNKISVHLIPTIKTAWELYDLVTKDRQDKELKIPFVADALRQNLELLEKELRAANINSVSATVED